MSQNRTLRGIDWITIIMALMLIVFGIMNIYSVDEAKGLRQLTFFGLSFILIIVLISVSSTTSNFFEVYSPFVYLFSIVLLIAVLFFGSEINGAKAWFNFGFVSFQPAELAKLGTALLLANYISYPALEKGSRKTILTAFGILAVPVALIMKQPDFGSVLVFSAFIVALYREGFSPWYIFIPVIGGSLFLMSISYPAYYVLTAIGCLTAIIGLFIVAFTYNRTMLKTVMGMEMGVALFFILLIGMTFFFPEMGMIADETSKHFVYLEKLCFNVYLYSILGLIISVLTAISVAYFIIYDNSDSPFRITSSEFGSNLTYGTSIVTTIILLMVMGISLFSSKIYSELPKHQQERIMVLFEGEKKYRDTTGYNLLYSKTAIGSGDLLGKGYLQGTVKMGRFVPEQSTDFIFCTVGEEWGFVGSVILIVFYGLFILRIYKLAESQRSVFSRFFGYSVATIFLIHFFINIAMVMGLFPTVGIPLPFFSYGGSSLWAFITLITIFLILNYKDKQSLI